MARSPDGPADEAELLRLFQEQVTHLEHAAATALAQRLLGGGFAASGAFSHPAPPSARRPRRPDVVTLRVRVDLQHPRPPLWRRLELASGTMLNELDTGSRARGPPRRTAGRRRDRLTLRLRLRRRLDAHPQARGGAAARRLDTAGRVHGRPGPPEDCGGGGGYEMWCAATDPGHPAHAAALAGITDMYGAELEPGGYAPTPSTGTRSTWRWRAPPAAGSTCPRHSTTS